MAGAVTPPIDVLAQAWRGEATEAGLVELAATLGRRLAEAGARIVTAESCTGGAIARALTETAGSSAWFDRGFVTYSNDAKQALLGVPADLLARHGAVSEPVAAAMAEGALRAIGLPGLALAVTGIAGPGGAVPGKPVGTVCFGWAGGGDAAGALWVRTATVRFDGDRTAVRLASARHALAGGLALWAPTGAEASGPAPGG